MTCAICGNKRCPKATDCALECTNSMENNKQCSHCQKGDDNVNTVGVNQ